MTEAEMRIVLKSALNALTSVYLYQQWGEHQENAMRGLQWALAQPLTPSEIPVRSVIWRKRQAEQKAVEIDDDPE